MRKVTTFHLSQKVGQEQKQVGGRGPGMKGLQEDGKNKPGLTNNHNEHKGTELTHQMTLLS